MNTETKTEAELRKAFLSIKNIGLGAPANEHIREMVKLANHGLKAMDELYDLLRPAGAIDKRPHWSDCSVHNEPAYRAGICDCGRLNYGADGQDEAWWVVDLTTNKLMFRDLPEKEAVRITRMLNESHRSAWDATLAQGIVVAEGSQSSATERSEPTDSPVANGDAP